MTWLLLPAALPCRPAAAARQPRRLSPNSRRRSVPPLGRLQVGWTTLQARFSSEDGVGDTHDRWGQLSQGQRQRGTYCWLGGHIRMSRDFTKGQPSLLPIPTPPGAQLRLRRSAAPLLAHQQHHVRRALGCRGHYRLLFGPGRRHHPLPAQRKRYGGCVGGGGGGMNVDACACVCVWTGRGKRPAVRSRGSACVSVACPPPNVAPRRLRPPLLAAALRPLTERASCTALPRVWRSATCGRACPAWPTLLESLSALPVGRPQQPRCRDSAAPRPPAWICPHRCRCTKQPVTHGRLLLQSPAK